MNTINVSHVYCILNTHTDKRYVGSTSRPVSTRKRQHIYELRKGKHPSRLMQKDFDECGEKSLVFFVLEDVLTFDRDELFSREQYWIDQYKPEYNTNELAGNHIPPSGKTKEAKQKQAKAITGRKQSQETKDKRANSIKKFWETHPAKIIPQEMRDHLSKINTGESNPNWGLKRTDQTRKAISDANAKHVRTGFISPDGAEYRNVKNMGWFCREHSLNYFCMRDLDHGRLKSYKGWTKIQQ